MVWAHVSRSLARSLSFSIVSLTLSFSFRLHSIWLCCAYRNALENLQWKYKIYKYNIHIIHCVNCYGYLKSMFLNQGHLLWYVKSTIMSASERIKGTENSCYNLFWHIKRKKKEKTNDDIHYVLLHFRVHFIQCGSFFHINKIETNITAKWMIAFNCSQFANLYE